MYTGKYLGLTRVKDSNWRLLISFDPSEHPVISAYAMNRWIPNDVSLKYKRYIRRTLESQLVPQLQDRFGKFLAENLGDRMLGSGKDLSTLTNH